MEWNDVLIYVVESAVGIVLSIGIPYLIIYIRKKTQNEKLHEYLAVAENVIYSSVQMVSQTFVDQLKKDGKFDLESQKIAFNKAREQILVLLSEEAKKAVISVYGDLEEYLKTQIEASVLSVKSNI